MNPYLLVALSVTCEVFGDACMKLSDGFKRRLPILGILAGYAASFYLLSLALSALPLGVAYAIYTGAGVVLTALVGDIVWHEGFNVKKVLGICLIIVGIMFLRLAA